MKSKNQNIKLNHQLKPKPSNILPSIFKRAIFEIKGKINLDVIRKEEELIGKNEKEIINRILNVMGLNVFRGGVITEKKLKKIGEVLTGTRKEKVHFLVCFLMNKTLDLKKIHKMDDNTNEYTEESYENNESVKEKIKMKLFRDWNKEKECLTVEIVRIKAILKILCNKMTEGKDVFEKILENLQLEKEYISQEELLKKFETDHLFFLDDFMKLILCEFA